MATYTPILIGSDFVGGSQNVQVVESNGAGTLNQLLSTVGTEKYIIDSLELWSDDPMQLSKPIGLLQVNPNGNINQKLLIPQKSRFQWANVIKNIKTDDYPLDENTRITYSVNPNTNVRFTLNINKAVRQDNSLAKDLQNAGASSIKSDVLDELGMSDAEIRKILGDEPEKKPAKKELSATGEPENMQPQRVDVIPAKKLIFAGLVITAVAFIIYSQSGAAPSFFKTLK